jgi:lincosamide nucleotidyltransferase A/C/D/E
MPTMIVLRDGRRRWIELMVVDVSAPSPGEDSRPEDMRFRYVDDAFTTGSLDGHLVRCLAPSVQLLFHSGYPARDTDRHDVRLLTARFGLPTPDGFG